MAAPLTATTGTSPGLLQGAKEAVGKAFDARTDAEVELTRRKRVAEAKNPGFEATGPAFAQTENPSQPTRFNLNEPTAMGQLDRLNPLTPQKFVMIGPEASKPEAGMAETVAGKMRPTDIATAGEQLTDAQIQDRMNAQFAGSPHLASGGGYTAMQAKSPGEFQEGREAFLGATNDVLDKRRQYREAVQPLTAEHATLLDRQRADEQGRMDRLVGRGKDLETLNQGMAKKVDEFQVDPNRLFGQGAQRAATTFALGLQNIMSNVGEAMQGKAGTNAVLTLVRDRIAQDVDMQEKDYGRMMQGYQVQRNGLMDAIQQIGNERAGAEALSRQQALVYANQLDQIADRIGLKDAEAAYPLKTAAAKMFIELGGHKQSLDTFNVGQVNQARHVAATTAAAASATNANILNERDRARGLAESSFRYVSPTDMPRIQQVLDKAGEKNLAPQYSLLQQAKKAIEADPSIGTAMASYVKIIADAMGKSKDQTLVTPIVTQLAAQENLTPSQRSAIALLREFNATKMTGLGGKNLTQSEMFLYDPFLQMTGPADLSRILDQQMENVQGVKQGLLGQSGFEPGSMANRYLAARLTELVPSDYVSQAAPTLQGQAKETK